MRVRLPAHVIINPNLVFANSRHSGLMGISGTGLSFIVISLLSCSRERARSPS